MSIIFKDIEFSYDSEGRNILNECSGEFLREKITVLTGASGCGKSTLLYLAAGLYPHNAGILKKGSITVEGQQPDNLKPSKRCRVVGMMFQNPELQFCMDTVYNELIFCLENVCCEPDEMDERIDESLGFCGITELKYRDLHSLSGGERQKVMLACIVMQDPDWLLLDEPFANIDDESAKTICGKLRRLHDERNVGILAVDHRLDNWIDFADELRVMKDGRLSGTVMNMKNPDEAFLEDNGIIVPGRHYVLSKGSAGDKAEASPILKLENVSLSFGKKEVLKNVNAEFKRGMIYAVVGQSGCGKSTLFNALFGINRFRGNICAEGQPFRKWMRKNAGKIGFVMQNPQDQFIGGTVMHEVLSSLKGTGNAEETARDILKSIKLWRYRDVSPYLLSQGQQRRLGVAALMAYDCRILVCDEPTYAQDRYNTVAIMERLCAQARERNAAVIFSTHDMQLARDYADVIYSMKEGTLCEQY